MQQRAELEVALLAIVLDAPDAGAVRAPVPQLQHVPLSTAAAR